MAVGEIIRQLSSRSLDVPGQRVCVPVERYWGCAGLALRGGLAHQHGGNLGRAPASSHVPAVSGLLQGDRLELRLVRPIWKRYGIQPLSRGQDHSAFVFLIDR